MPESTFGRPSQHLLPSHPPASASASPVVSDPVAPLSFKDFRFSSIGKQPELLSRISLPQPEHIEYHSPTPSPASTPLFTLTNNTAFPSQSSSRPTLFQQLAGNDASAMNGGSRTHASTSQSNGSLASRIQMDVRSSNDIPSTVHAENTGSSSLPLRVDTSKRATEDASLIPPVEVLPQSSDSSSATPASLVLPLEPMDVHSPASSTLLVNTGTTRTFRVPTPITTTNIVSGEQTESFPSSAVDAMIQNLEPPSTTPTIDSLIARQEHLQAISASLANLALLPPSSSHSSSPDPSLVARATDNNPPHQSNQSQHSAIPIVLRHPYPTNQLPSRAGLDINNMPMDTNNSSLSLVPSPTTLTQEHQTQRRAFIEAVQNVNSALHALLRVQVDSEYALTHQLRVFGEQRAAFEQTQQVEAARLQQESQELQKKREELDAKEADLTSWEKESKAREDARKAMTARRQAQEEEKRAAEAKSVQETRERIATAMKEIMEVEVVTLRDKRQLGLDLPTEPQEDMNEEEMVAIKARNDLLCDVKHFHQLHAERVQNLEESNSTLRRLQEERKMRQVEQAENRRIAEEERLRAHAEAQRARQIQNEQRRQLEARQAIENGRERAWILVEQQAYARAEALAHGLRRPETTSSQTSEHRSYPEEVNGSQQQVIPDVKRIRAIRESSPCPPAATIAMSVDADKRAPVSHRTVPPPVVHTDPRALQSTTPQLKQKKDGSVSGGVMLAAPSTKARGGHLPPKPLTKPPSLSSSNRVVENTVNFLGTSPAVKSMSTEELIRAADTPADMRSTPDHRPPFPRTPKSQTILDATNRGSQELNIGPAAGVSPTQRNVNLRHLKRSRGRVEENDSGDRSVRMTNVKCEENYFPSLKEEDNDQLRELASLPPRPTVIPPPRPWLTRKRQAVSATQTDSISSYPKSNEPSSMREAEAATDEQPGTVQSRVPSSLAMDAPVQLPIPAETTDSLLLRLVHPEVQSTESRINAGERPVQDYTANYDTTSAESATTALSHEFDGEDSSRNNRISTEERRWARNENSSRRLSDHHPPSPRSTAVSPTQPHRLIDSWRPQNTSNGPRAEPMRATSPTSGRKRPSEFGDSEHRHRARRHRPGYVSMAQDHDHNRVDPYRPHWDRNLGSEHDEHRIVYRDAPDRMRPYPSDTTYDNRNYVPPSEEFTTLPARREQPYRRPENDDAYQWYQPPAPDYRTMADQHYVDDPRIGQAYEQMTEERMDTQLDPSLLARISTTQRFQVTIVRRRLDLFYSHLARSHQPIPVDGAGVSRTEEEAILAEDADVVIQHEVDPP